MLLRLILLFLFYSRLHLYLCLTFSKANKESVWLSHQCVDRALMEAPLTPGPHRCDILSIIGGKYTIIAGVLDPTSGLGKL